MSTEFINIYTDDQSDVIVNNLQDIISYPNLELTNLGEQPRSPYTYKNKFYLEVNVFNENDSFLFKLNTGKPLLMTEGGEYYLGEYHLYNYDYMVGKVHSIQPHGTLIKVRESQIDIFPLTRYSSNYGASHSTEYCIKPSQIFDIMKKVPSIDLQKNTKYKIQHVIMKDAILAAGGYMSGAGLETGGMD